MRITTITVGRTYNTGAYTSQRFELTAQLDDGENEAIAVNDLAYTLRTYAQAVIEGAPRDAFEKLRNDLHTTITVEERGTFDD